MASYLPKKKYLSQLVQDTPECLAGYSSLTSSRVEDASGISCSVSSPLMITANSRIPSFLLMSDSQRNLSDSDLKLLGSPLMLGSFCNERFGSGISLDSLEKFCTEQEAYNSENGDGAAMVSSTYQRPVFFPVVSSCSLLSHDFSSEDLMLLSSGSLMQKTVSSGGETRPTDPPLASHDPVEIAQDALLPSLPSLSSFSSLSEMELNAHPSTGSFSSILNGLDANERAATPVGSLMRNLLTGTEDQQTILSDTLLPYDSNFAKTLSSQSLFTLQQSVLFNSTYRLKPGAPGAEPKDERGSVPNNCRSPTNSTDVYIKEEMEEENVEAKQVQVTTSGRNRGSGKSREPKYECQVCGDVAAGYHCGAYVCEACKKFYLRCLKTRGAPAFLCPKNNDCDITKDTRSHCQYCRFQKCISLGMYKPGHEDDKKLKINFKVIPCKVCSAPSSGFHFGAITCEGCKGFFRRMLKEQLHKKFVCVNDEPCNIDSANRTTCKCCRFEKCLQVGMTLEGTRLGRQSNSVKRRTLMQYVSPEQLSALNRRNFDGTVNDDMSEASITDSTSAPDHLKEADEEEDENSCSAPLCINFPSIKVSRERLPSQSSLTSPQAEVAMPTQANSSRRSVGKPDPKLRRKDAGNGGSLPVGWKSNSHCAEAYQSNAAFASNNLNLEESKAKSTNFVSRCSALVDTPKSVVYANNKATTNFCTENSEHAYQSYETVRRKGDFAEQELSTWTLSNPAPDRLQHESELYRSNTVEVDPHCTKYAEASNRNTKALKRSFANTDLYSEGPSCSTQNSIQPRAVAFPEQVGPESRDVDVNLMPSAQHHVPITNAAFSNPDRPTVGLSPTFGVISPSSSTGCENVVHPLSAEGDARLYRSPQALFGHLVTAFRELEEISHRPAELDELQFCPVSIQTIWKLVEIPFIHQSKIILRFIKKVPGFRQLAVEDQIQIAQESLYPIVLLYHSRSYDLETGEFDWFISTAKERDIILNVLTPFRTMQNHFRCIGHIVKRLNMTEEELAFVAAMSVLTASEGSPLQSGNRVYELQDELLEAFVSYQQEGSGWSPSQRRIGELLARLPELKRANIEHRLIVAQVQQLIPEIEMSSLYQEIFLSGRGGVQR